ncbi:MAG TPA: hypothetical protein PKY56_08230 [Candidatus Kapabacteria bacterium]|nr:hypothetical protein [Candidatus Kapabacteria bacterium]
MNNKLKYYFATFILLAIFTIINSNPFTIYAQETEKTEEAQTDSTEEYDEDIPDRLRFYKEQYEETYNFTFEIVWGAVKKAIENTGCLIEQESSPKQVDGLYKGSVKSNMCVFVENTDSTFALLNNFSYHLPVIYGGVWINGRIQYKFSIREQQDGSCKVILKTEMSGFEQKVTSQVHFWKSNGLLEMAILDKVKKILEEQQ